MLKKNLIYGLIITFNPKKSISVSVLYSGINTANSVFFFINTLEHQARCAYVADHEWAEFAATVQPLISSPPCKEMCVSFNSRSAAPPACVSERY